MQFLKVTGFRQGFHVPPNANVEAACKTLNKLVNRSNGASVEDTIDAARPLQSPLRPFFTWDADEALIKVQKDEARNLLASMLVEVVTDEDEKEPKTILVRATALVTSEDEEEKNGRYVPIQRVIDDSEKRAQQLVMARKELVSLARRWWFLTPELDLVFTAIKKCAG